MTNDLEFRRVCPGAYAVSAEFGGEAGAFAADVRRDEHGIWNASCTTYGRPLDFHTFRTLSEARAHVRAVFAAVEV